MNIVPVEDVANFILILGNQYDDGDPISPLKLQKLLYYCQGIHLAAYDCPLFDEDIEAWEHGPVVVSIWYKYREYGNRAINAPSVVVSSLADIQKRLVEKVYDAYGQYTAWKLRNLTHQNGPWKQTRRNRVISHEAMRLHFINRIRRK